VALLVCASFYVLYRFVNVFFVLFVAVVLATALRPAVLWLERWRIPQWLGILLIYLFIVIGMVGLAALLAPLLITQVISLVNNAPEHYANLLEYLRGLGNPITRSLAGQLPSSVSVSAQVTIDSEDQLAAIAQAGGYTRSLAWGVFGLIAAVLIIYFWILDRDQIIRTGVLLLPADRRDGARDLLDTLEEKVGAFVRGQALLSLSIGVLSLIAFVVIGVPNPLVLAVLAGIFEAVPYIGPIFTAVLAIVLTLAQAPEKVVWVIIASVVIQQVENALLVPRIMGRTVGVNAVVTLLAITAFGTLLGIGGAIMAIPMAVILQVVFQRMIQTAQQAPVAEVTGRDQFAVLRYQAQDLASDLRNRSRALPDRADQTGLEEELEQIIVEVDQLLQTASILSSEDTQPTTDGLRSIGSG
jgi:predicted PurR-regulated permease PerM